jgi:rhamnopyranosyl-N-acetylglucosaminyl-diphospho-decaprenol beta-1,3/1,4-galactofuranosyltransferase
MKEKDKETVCAVVVTYNRKNLLLECLDALRKQTRPIQGIYLIDNASTDGTPELLLEKGYIKELPPKDLAEPWEKEFEIENLTDGQLIKLYYVRMHENTGGAGGFHEGVKRAYEKGYDWLWLMDDDVEPNIDALEEMLKFKSISKCIHPLKRYLDGTYATNENHFNPSDGSRFYLNNISFKNGKKWCSVSTGCFEGMLIHRDIVNKIGYPDKRFFIWGDDAIYGFLANLYTNTIYIKTAIFKKKIKKPQNQISCFQIYYSIRNEFIIREYMKNLGFYKKNNFYLYLKLIRKVLIILIKEKSLKKTFIAIKAIKDGHYKKFFRSNLF